MVTLGGSGSRSVDIEAMRVAQSRWSRVSVSRRLELVARFRALLVSRLDDGLKSIDLGGTRSPTEILTSELLPLLDACRFLERNARRLLAPQRLSKKGRPVYLVTNSQEIRREPYGIVLILSPWNYPLFIPGVQVLQALTAGNAVILKPGRQGSAAACLLSELFVAAELPDGLLAVMEEDTEAVQPLFSCGIDKVVLTGSAATGKAVLQKLAPLTIPCTLELSGHDAVFVRADADLDLAVAAILFGTQLNRGRTCIAPRRLFVQKGVANELAERLACRLRELDMWSLEDSVTECLIANLKGALKAGAVMRHGAITPDDRVLGPVLLTDVSATAPIAQEACFGPLLLVVGFDDDQDALRLHAQCAYALGAAIFSADEQVADRLADRLGVGFVSINDLIAPSADPRLPFGGRRASGFGLTRGGEGLLEMTVVKVVTHSRGHWRPHFEASRPGDLATFKELAVVLHGQGLLRRGRALLKVFWALLYANAIEHRRRRMARHSDVA